MPDLSILLFTLIMFLILVTPLLLLLRFAWRVSQGIELVEVERTEREERECAQCGRLVESAWENCPNCGAPMESTGS